MLTEMLSYTLKVCSISEFHHIMLTESLPLHRQAGIDVIWAGPAIQSEVGYCLIRCFASEAEMESTLSSFYASQAWIQGPREAIVSRIESSHRLLLPGRFTFSAGPE